ncbi:MAG: hypothetical protein ACLTBK_09370 [Blautia wexlerae]
MSRWMNFSQWLDGKDLIPRIQEIKDEAVNDLNLRIAKPTEENTHMEELEDRAESGRVQWTRAMEKVVNKLLFGLRDSHE